MNKYKICVYAISKNEENFAARWMDAVKEADLVVVTDTGSTDGTVDALRAAGAIVYQEKIEPWRFDTARNIAMDHIPEDVDICVSNDLDELFEPGWRQKLEEAWDPSYTRAKYLFTWSYNPDGTPNKQFPMEKIHRRHGFRWVHPVHEVLSYSGPDEDKTVWVKGLVLNHYPDLSKPRAQYLPLLELSAKENPGDDRTMFWLGREYMYHGKYDLCIITLKKHLLLPSAIWNEERSASMRFIGTAYEAKGNLKEAMSWFFRAVAECQEVREPYMKLAMVGCAKENWLLALSMAEKAMGIIRSTGSYLVEPENWGGAPFCIAALSASRLGLSDKARDYAAIALKAGGIPLGLQWAAEEIGLLAGEKG